MKINFNKIIVHNFLSFNHAELDLQNRGYCSVLGVNNCKIDNAKSNGSGKSSIWSGICWVLTGQTIQGITSNIKNLYVNENSCYVTLDFNINNNHYELTRFKEPKVDLKIKLDGVDISGKGLRESEQILTQYLPDLTSDLISSIILLGQGLPNKLSSKSPSGRKELLEKLSKSDFMIEDIKDRLTNRESYLKNQNYWTETNKIQDETTYNLNIQSIKDISEELYQTQSEDYNLELTTYKVDLQNVEMSLQTYLESKIDDEINNTKNLIDEIECSKRKELDFENDNYQTKYNDLKFKQTEKQLLIQSLQAEINRLNSITDICPTCGQKIPGVVKVDTSDKENQLKQLKDELDNLVNFTSDITKNHQIAIDFINTSFNDKMVNFKLKLNDLENKLNEISKKVSDLNISKLDLLLKINQLEERIKLREDRIQDLKNKLDKLNSKQLELEESIDEKTSKIEYYKQHLDIINKMNTLIKRDFRGYLLTNIISYINKVLKEYSLIVFGNENIDFILNGNNIDILYNDKIYESLSGGEKQKIDILVQLALRKMLMNYLDFSSNILILDEIFDNLDSIGTNNIIDLIESKLTDIDSIFIISHHIEELNIPTDTELKVIKNNLGISEVYA